MKNLIFALVLTLSVAAVPFGLIHADDRGDGGGENEDRPAMMAPDAGPSHMRFGEGEDISKIELPESDDLDEMMKPLDTNPFVPMMKKMHEFNDEEASTSSSTRPFMTPAIRFGLDTADKVQLVTQLRTLIDDLLGQLQALLGQSSTSTASTTAQ